MQRNVKTVFMEVDIRIENRVFLILDYKNQKFNIQKIISSEDKIHFHTFSKQQNKMYFYTKAESKENEYENTTFMNNRILLENHLYFLSKHRGVRDSYPDADLIHSDKESFNIIFLKSPENIYSLPESYRIYIPAHTLSIQKLPEKYKPLGSITYMTLSHSRPIWNLQTKLKYKRVDTIESMEDFSLVQSRGFCETQEIFDEWYPWMRNFNLKNQDDPVQSFWVAYKDESPVGVCLTIETESCTGIYAVATLPSERKQGISTSLIHTAIQSIHKVPDNIICLQVETNSYAHNFYKKLGFTDAFECLIFKHF